MVGGSWMNNDGLYVQYGTQKAVPEVAGDYLSYGETRQVEISIDLTKLTATPLIISNTTFMGTGVFIESVELDVETAATATSTLSVGLIGNDRTTVASNTGFINAETTAHMTQGNKITYVGPVAGQVGAYVGLAAGTPSVGYITATGTATAFTAGQVKVRINYRGIGTITQ
jgi:hypothetical protein